MQTFRQKRAAAVIPVIGLLALSSCQPEPVDNAVGNETVSPAPRLPPLPVAEEPMDRAALLEAVAKAASAVGLGQNDAEEQRRLDGKRFEVRIRFGCAITAQPGSTAGPFNVRFNGEDRTLRVRASPDLTLDDPFVAALGGETIEAVEGFWMRRPWLLTDGCPVVPPSPPQSPDPQSANEPAAAASRSHRVGLGQFFTSADSRTQRRQERAYEATKVLGEGERPSREGYNLVLSGRLRKLSGGRSIHCRILGPNQPPECVISAEFDRVRIETPGSKDVLAEWGR